MAVPPSGNLLSGWARCSGSAGAVWQPKASSGLVTRERVPMLLKSCTDAITHPATHHTFVSRNL